MRAIRWPWLAIPAATLAACARLLWIVHRYGVNIFFWDQWDYLDPLFGGDGLRTRCTWQHGPLREGVEYRVIDGAYALSGWDTRSDGLTAVVAMACAAIVLLAV